MRCYVYRSPRKVDTYLYLKEAGDFSVIPAELLRVFGAPEYALEFELTPERKLAQEDAHEVLASLDARGFHLQMPAENREPF